MPRKSLLGKLSTGKSVTLPDDAVTAGFGILARRRSGKSTLAGVIEETFCERGDPWVALDPAAAHWGIVYQDDNGKPGKASGNDVLLVGGEYGHVRLDEHSGAALAEIIVDTNISCVIDLKMAGMAARQRFVADFANELFRINRSPRHLILEEAQAFIPQQPRWDEQKMVLYAIERLIKEGGGQGIGFTVITQRPASVSKDVLTQIDNLFVLRMSGPQDIAAVKAWFEHNVGDAKVMKDILGTLPSLVPGECWMLTPEMEEKMRRLQVRQRETYHAGRTPKRGDAPIKPKRIELGAVIERFKKAATTRQLAVAEEKSDKARIKELEQELRRKPVATPDENAMEQRINQAIAGERSKAVARQRQLTAGLVNHVERAGTSLRSALDGYVGSVVRLTESLNGHIELSTASEPAPVRQPAVLPTDVRREALPVDDLKSGALNVLRELARRHPLRPNRNELATLSGYKITAPTFRAHLNVLRAKGLIEGDNAALGVTEVGLDIAGHDLGGSISTHEQMMSMWSKKLDSKSFLVLQAVIANKQTVLEIADALGYHPKAPSLKRHLNFLVRNGLITEESGAYRPAEMLWP